MTAMVTVTIMVLNVTANNWCLFRLPATDSFPVISSTVLGSFKRAGILGERSVPFLEKHGNDSPRLRKEAVSPALQSEQRYILVSLPNVWQVFQETGHPPAAIAHFFVH